MIYLCITVDGLLRFPHPCNAKLLAPARICVLYPRTYLSSKVFLSVRVLYSRSSICQKCSEGADGKVLIQYRFRRYRVSLKLSGRAAIGTVLR